MTVDRLELPVRDAKVEVVGGFAVPVVEVNDLAVVDVFLGELVARVRDVLGRDEPALRRHVHDVVNNVRVVVSVGQEAPVDVALKRFGSFETVQL